jgi:hypothetical protein
MTSTQHVTRHRGYVRPADGGARMRVWLARYGEPEALRHFALSRLAIARAAAGMVILGATLRAVEEGLARPVAEEPQR